jgi:hypothetical protein
VWRKLDQKTKRLILGGGYLLACVVFVVLRAVA